MPGKRNRSVGRKRKAKLVVTFDEDERSSYLTGFRKRKTQRREQAIIEAVQRERKLRVEDRASKREERVKGRKERTCKSDKTAKDAGERSVSRKEEVVEDNEFAKRQFGSSVVTVTTEFGFGGSESSDEDNDGFHLKLGSSVKAKLAAHRAKRRAQNLEAEQAKLSKSQAALVNRRKELMKRTKRERIRAKKLRSKSSKGKSKRRRKGR